MDYDFKDIFKTTVTNCGSMVIRNILKPQSPIVVFYIKKKKKKKKKKKATWMIT